MGGWAQAITQGLGRAGSEFGQARQLKMEEAQRQLQMLQAQLGLTEMQQRIRQSAAPQFIGQHTDPTGLITNTTRNPFTGKLSTEAGGRESVKPLGVYKSLLTEAGDYILYNDVTGERKSLTDEKGQPIRGFPKGKNGPLIVDGKPIGVIRNGRPLTPDDPEFTPSDAMLLASSLKGYEESEAKKTKRVELAAQSRAWAWMQMPLSVYDTQTNSMTYASKNQIDKDPGRYTQPSEADKVLNARRLFKEIDTTTAMLNDAIAKLPNDAFEEKARAQVALVLRDERPKAALYEFLNSQVASTLSPEQVDYVTALVSMQESALSLRPLAGMGQGSDTMRAAIVKMLPGAGTPSKAYALRQMNVFKNEEEALKTGFPNLGNPKVGGVITPQTKGKGTGTESDPHIVP